jgi:Protein of unknown function (DUF2752)
MSMSSSPAFYSGRKAAALGLAAAICGSVLVCLYFFDPARHAIYPVCYFHRFTGLDCPGCGSLRAMHHLLHGELLLAFRFNPLLITALPWLLVWVIRGTIRAGQGKPNSFAVPTAWYWYLLAVIIVFGVVRNLPVPFLHPGLEV